MILSYMVSMRVLVLIGFCLSIVTIKNSDCVTVLLTLHGLGENADNGEAHSFVTHLNQQLKEKSLNKNYEIINVGLSEDGAQDYCWSSYSSMYYQTYKLCAYINKREIWHKLANSSRIVLIGFSQGGLLLRGLLWTQCLDPFVSKIDRLITFGSPHSGIFGKPDCNEFDTKSHVLMNMCYQIQKLENDKGFTPSYYDVVMYSDVAQLFFSPSSYWSSPKNPDTSLTWLAKINNFNNSNNGYRYLSQKLKRGLVLIEFEHDSIIKPPISSSFGYWDSDATILLPYNQTEMYRNDWIGLKELDARGLLKFYVIKGETHMNIPDKFISDKFFEFILLENDTNGKTENRTKPQAVEVETRCEVSVIRTDQYNQCLSKHREAYNNNKTMKNVKKLGYVYSRISIDCYVESMKRMCITENEINTTEIIHLDKELVANSLRKNFFKCDFSFRQQKFFVFIGLVMLIALVLVVSVFFAIKTVMKCHSNVRILNNNNNNVNINESKPVGKYTSFGDMNPQKEIYMRI